MDGRAGQDLQRRNAARVESTKASGLANAETEVDVATFTEWVDAYLKGDRELADFYEQRFRDEFEPAFRAWLRTDPFDAPDAPPSPFTMSEYVIAARDQAEKLEADADRLAEEARNTVQRATNYVLGVVLAIVLFFAGVSTKLEAPRLRTFVLAAGLIVFLVALGWIATFPISISI